MRPSNNVNYRPTSSTIPSDFIAEIVADPDSIQPRLVYADWLSENGDPRGDYIRAQCECETLDLRVTCLPVKKICTSMIEFAIRS